MVFHTFSLKKPAIFQWWLRLLSLEITLLVLQMCLLNVNILQFIGVR